MRYVRGMVKTVVATVGILWGATVQAGELRISVAASMTDLFKELTASFMAANGDVRIITNFGPSGGLAKQIDQGAPAHLYVSANPKWMNYLIERKKIDASTSRVFAHNRLVFVGMSGKGVDGLEDLQKLERIGLGSPKSVPAGQYAKEALEKRGLYKPLLQAGKLVMAKDVRQALIYADRGETGGSFVYKTDAMLLKKAEVLFEVPQELYNKVSYPVGLTEMGASNPDAQAFLRYVSSPGIHKALIRYGFTLPE